MPSTGPRRAARLATARASPRSRSQARSATVARLPGRITRSASAISAGEVTNRSATSGSAASGSVSVKLLIRGSRTTATRSTSPPGAAPPPGPAPPGTAPRLSESSASSHSPAVHGSTPSTGRPVSSRDRSSPGCRRAASPRNLFTTNPATSAWSSRLSRASVPYSAASAPPRSMSATTITGRPAARARPMLARSCARRLISAGLPAPSQTTTSNRPASPVRQARTVSARRGFSAG